MNFRVKHTTCYHCGESCDEHRIVSGGKSFCCQGCRMVFELLTQLDMNEYYQIQQSPGIKLEEKDRFSDYAFLDIPAIKKGLIDFSTPNTEKVSFRIPAIHCSSCIWLIENLARLQSGVIRSEADFLKKTATVLYDPSKLSLRKLVETLDSIGYKPELELSEDQTKTRSRKRNLSYIYRLGISGFAFGNTMLLSFPEYFQEGMYDDQMFGSFFGYINLVLAIPVFFYCAWPYFESALKGLRGKFLNIDVPIALGIVVLFSRSTYEVLAGTGAGYFDSLTGLVFFLLIGRWFQNQTYQALSFERDYRSYFPLAITKLISGQEVQVLLKEIREGDHLIIRNGDVIPADSKLISNHASIDYSFVTGEAELVNVSPGEPIFAGGRQNGTSIEIETTREFSQSYLMQLWKNEDKGRNLKQDSRKMIDRVSQYFTAVILFISIVSGLYWYVFDPSKIIPAMTAVLIIACPCALAMTMPFTYGFGLRILEKSGLYLRDSRFIEMLAEIRTVIFDKTGTITSQKLRHAEYHGKTLSEKELVAIKSLVVNSNHPLSRALSRTLDKPDRHETQNFSEIHGKGIQGTVDGINLKLGSSEFILGRKVDQGSAVYVEIDGDFKGYFSIDNIYRGGLKSLADKLKSRLRLEVITGDTDAERSKLESFFGREAELKFRMSPFEKRDYLIEKRNKGQKVLMIGDGLNDAGAIMESHVGLSISDDIYGFMPSSDGIMEANSFSRLNDFLCFARDSKRLVMAGFAISFLYNIVGLTFAVQGILSPIIAAILMPLSSLTVVLFAMAATSFFARRRNI